MTFAEHVAQGLTAPQAHLSSRYIYDARGSRLFQRIMRLDAYYLTDCEAEIFRTHGGALAGGLLGAGAQSLELIELGAGDGAKTRLLIDELQASGRDWTYRPVDISADILAELSGALAGEYPGLRVAPVAASYDDALAALAREPAAAGVRRAVLLLGSNIGNFSYGEAVAFCGRIARALRRGDRLVIGVDLRKDPRRILAAYDDPEGVTAAFNLNLLHRVNGELGGDFDVDAWGFYPTYNPETGEVRSYLYPHAKQRVSVAACGVDRVFRTGEAIHTEVSRKYSREELATLAGAAGFSQESVLTDRRGYFADVSWTRT